MSSLMNTKEAAQYLGINEKKIYSLISDQGCLPPRLPANGSFNATCWTAGWSTILRTIPQLRLVRKVTKTYL